MEEERKRQTLILERFIVCKVLQHFLSSHILGAKSEREWFTYLYLPTGSHSGSILLSTYISPANANPLLTGPLTVLNLVPCRPLPTSTPVMIQKTSQRQLNALVPNPSRVNTPDEWGQWVRNKSVHQLNANYALTPFSGIIHLRSHSILSAPECVDLATKYTAFILFFSPCSYFVQDRRPLAPAAVAKMIVRREDNSILEVESVCIYSLYFCSCSCPFASDIDVDFFLVTVDLWSADGKEERNLVLHPSSADRYVPPQPVKLRKKGPSNSGAPLRPARPSPYPMSQSRPPSNHPPGSNSDFTLRPIEPTVGLPFSLQHQKLTIII